MFALMVAGVPVISFSWRAYAQRFWPSGNILSRGITWQNQDVFVCAVNYHILTNSLVYNINWFHIYSYFAVTFLSTIYSTCVCVWMILMCVVVTLFIIVLTNKILKSWSLEVLKSWIEKYRYKEIEASQLKVQTFFSIKNSKLLLNFRLSGN